MNALDFAYNCCTNQQLPEMSDFSSLVIVASRPNSNEDGETNTQVITDLNEIRNDAERSSVFYTLNGVLDDGEWEPLHDEESLVTLMEIANNLSKAAGLPLTFPTPLPVLSVFDSFEINAVVERDGECEALPGVASGTVNKPTDDVFYTLYGRYADGRVEALLDEPALSVLTQIALDLASSTALPLITN